MDEPTRQRIERLEREVAALRTRDRRRQSGAARAWLLGGLLVLLLALSPLGALAANFVDLNPGSGHNANIDAIADAGITKGCFDTAHYCPNDFVTREQMASFLARTAGLGANPPVANAAQLGGLPASAFQRKYARTVVVGPVGTATENGSALRAALAGITTASATNPFLLKIEPGLYDLGATITTLKQFVDIEGSGEGITALTHSDLGAVILAGNMALRQLTIDCTGGAGCIAASAAGVANLRLSHVTLQSTSSTGGANGLFVSGAPSSITIEASTITVNAVAGGMGINYQAATSGTLTIRGSTIAVPAGGSRVALSMQSVGSHTATIEQSRLNATTNTLYASTNNVVRIADSQLAGGAVSNNGATLTCAGVYDENFAFSASTCP